MEKLFILDWIGGIFIQIFLFAFKFVHPHLHNVKVNTIQGAGGKLKHDPKIAPALLRIQHIIISDSSLSHKL